MSDPSPESLDKRLREIETALRAGEKPNIGAFLKRVPKNDRVHCLRSILRCHLICRLEKGKPVSPDHYARLGNKATSIAADEISKLKHTKTFSVDETQEGFKQGDIAHNPEDRSPVDPPQQELQIEQTIDSNRTRPDTDIDRRADLAKVDRYRIDKLLGEGGFGCVYLGFDEKLERSVAIKLPHENIIARPENIERYLNEARTVAHLDHPNIVPVHDVGSTGEHPFYIVSKFIEGKDLSSAIADQRMSFGESTKLAAKVAEALHHAHKHGIVHRDVKPGNILIDSDGLPYIVDFGLAYRDQDPLIKERQIIGSPAYMSPEQARGEGHRVNGRSDVFSLGVVFYELLTGKRPFQGNSITEVLGQILRLEPRPLRQYDERIPHELERICLKAISKKSEHRYSTAYDMAEDLRFCLDTSTQPDASISHVSAINRTSVSRASMDSVVSLSGSSQGTDSITESKRISIVPKGLRSFDVHDAEFFLQLLPGPRDRFGFPDSIRFWRTKIEDLKGDETFAVGMTYGPSGCGKSSFIKSGLLPHLSESIVPVYVESTPEQTEARLLGGIRRHLDHPIDEDIGLADVVASIRRGSGLARGRKLLIVLDQFEQWLHSRTNLGSSELVNAIRHCDGERVQCIVAVRDDFWMAATRFMNELEIRLEEDHNLAAVDLFPARHARNVLLAFGKAFGALPEESSQITEQHDRFLDDAIEELQTDGKVICVRLALFAEMMKDREWSPRSLSSVGGVEGLRVTYLEETFSKSNASPRNRHHEKAVRRVLKQLVPEVGTDIKGEMKSWEELKRSSEIDSTENFEELIHILDNETRLITPTDREGPGADSKTLVANDKRFFQLAHDYLVPSIHNWLALKQRETKQGRAELLLEERSSLWNAKPEKRQLPTLIEYIGIRRHVKRRRWTSNHQNMMQKAFQFHGFRIAAAAGAFAALLLSGWFVWHISVESKREQVASGMVTALINAKTKQTKQLISSMSDVQQWAAPIMSQKMAEYPDNSTERLHLGLAMVSSDPAQIDFLLKRLIIANPEETAAIRDALPSDNLSVVEKLWETAESEQGLLPASSVLAKLDASSPSNWDPLADRIAHQLLDKNVLIAAQWLEMLQPVDDHLVIPLKRIYLSNDDTRDEREIDKAKDFLVQSASVNWSSVAELILVGRPGDFNELFDLFAARPNEAAELIERELERPVGSKSNLDLRRKVNATIGALRLGNAELFRSQLRLADDTELRSKVIQAVKSSEVDLPTIVELIKKENEPSIRRALVQIAGTLPSGRLKDTQIETVLEIFKSDPDSGVHAAARWTLLQWSKANAVVEEEKRLAINRPTPPPERNWYVTATNEHTLVTVDGPVEFEIGSPDSEAGRGKDEKIHRMKIDRSFAVGSTEVTVAQFEQFESEAGLKIDYPSEQSPSAAHPRIGLNWFQAAKYCRWLSEKEGISESQMCYPAIANIKPGMKLPADFLLRTGYRLPTEAEWEYTCRAGSKSSRFFGGSDKLAPYYAWGLYNSDESTNPVATLLPNDLGVFDTYGNVSEWCQQVVKKYAEYRGEDRLFDLVVAGNVNRIVRGGTYTDVKATLRSGLRTDYDPKFRAINFGLRIARTLPADER